MIQTCAIFTKDHATESCPSLPRLKAVFKEVEEEVEPIYLLNQCRQWKARPTGMPTEPSLFFPSSQFNSQQYPVAAW